MFTIHKFTGTNRHLITRAHTIEEAKTKIKNIFLCEEDIDNPNHYDVITNSGEVYTIEPEK